MLRSRVNCSVMLVLPRLDDEVIWSTPAIVENCFSSGVATADAIVSGLAPGSPAPTWIVGKSTLGRLLTGSRRYAIKPNTDRKSTRPELQPQSNLVCRLLLEKKKDDHTCS